MTPYLLVLYYSRHGTTRSLAECIVQGAESAGLAVKLRTCPPVSADCEKVANSVPEEGPPYCTLDELANCSGLALGSPTRFGNMAAPLKYFLDSTSELWVNGSLINKPAACFSSSASLHGGQETTLVSMMLPLIHHGMVIAGLPYSETRLDKTTTGGTPYGPTHVSGHSQSGLSDDEQILASAMGKRLAFLIKALA